MCGFLEVGKYNTRNGVTDASSGSTAISAKDGCTGKPVSNSFSAGNPAAVNLDWVCGSVINHAVVGAFFHEALISMESVMTVKTGVLTPDSAAILSKKYGYKG